MNRAQEMQEQMKQVSKANIRAYAAPGPSSAPIMAQATIAANLAKNQTLQ